MPQNMHNPLADLFLSISGLPPIKNSSPYTGPLRDAHSDGHTGHHLDNSPLTIGTNDSHVTEHTDLGRASPYSGEDQVTRHAASRSQHVPPSPNTHIDKLKYESTRLDGANTKQQLDVQPGWVGV